jgi:DNA invertase Pin-like site-specific DNA recombinase
VVPPIAEFTEIETGKRNDRPQLKEALALCRKRKAKLVIAKLDRLSETNGVAERFFQTFKEQVVHGRIYQTIDDVRAAVRKFFELYNAGRVAH